MCFPAGWRLAEKAMRPLTAIHDPVPDYDADIARLFRIVAKRIAQPTGKPFSVHQEGDRVVLRKAGEQREEIELAAPDKATTGPPPPAA